MTGVRQALQVAKEISILTVACRQELLWVEGTERGRLLTLRLS